MLAAHKHRGFSQSNTVEKVVAIHGLPHQGSHGYKTDIFYVPASLADKASVMKGTQNMDRH